MICILSRADVRQALPMRLAIETMKQAFVQLSTGKADVPLRTRLLVPSHAGMTLFMPAYLSETDQMAVKIVSVFNENLAKGLPLIHALVVVVDATTGKPSAVMDGSYLTALRTGAASGAATDLLARQDTHSVFVFGAGVQGRTQLEAVCTVRPIQQAWVYDVDSGRALEFAAEMSVQLSIPIVVAKNPSQAARQADIICTATTSTTPVFEDADIRPGTHINAVGSYTPQMQEIPSQTVSRAKVVIDHREASLVEAGDLLIPIQEGNITPENIHAELGEIIAGLRSGRSSPDEITLFKSVGVAVQDVAAANAILACAKQLNLGRQVEL